jgi:hypothetical protein
LIVGGAALRWCLAARLRQRCSYVKDKSPLGVLQWIVTTLRGRFG